MRSEVGRWDVWFNVSSPSFGKFVLSMKLILWGDVGTAKGAGGGWGVSYRTFIGHSLGMVDSAFGLLYNPTLCSMENVLLLE